MRLRNTFERLYKKACKLLKNSINPVDITTWNLLSSGKVKVLTFDKLNADDFEILKDGYIDETSKALPSHYPPSKFTTKALENNSAAQICNNRIYICSYLETAHQMKRLIVHEVNHYINDSENHYDTPAQIFYEELRAKIAEKMSNNIPLTRFSLKKMSQKIANLYKVPLPAKIEIPQGIYYDEHALAKRRNKAR